MDSHHSSRMSPRVVLTLLAVTWACVAAAVIVEAAHDSGMASSTVFPIVALGGLGILVFLALVQIRRELALRTEMSFAASALTLERVVQVTDLQLHTLPFDEMLDEMATRLHGCTDADFVGVLLVEGDHVVVQAAVGALGAADIGARVAFGTGLVGRVAKNVRSLAATDVRRLSTVIPSIRHSLTSAAAAPMLVGDKLIGVLAIGHDERHEYDAGEIKLLELAAGRLANAIESIQLSEKEYRASLGAEHARRHLRLLGDASRVFMQSVDDYEPPLMQVVDLALKEFASFGAVFLADDQAGLQLLVARQAATDAPRLDMLTGTAMGAISEVMASGHSRLVRSIDSTRLDDAGRMFDDAMTQIGLTSYVIAPIQVRGLAFGAVVFGTDAKMRGYRPSDQHAVEELTRRTALAVEASLLYREALDSALVASGHLQRLRSLLDVWLAVAAAPDQAGILSLGVSGATRVLGAAQVTIVVDRTVYAATTAPDSLQLSDAAIDVLSRLDRPVSPASIDLIALSAEDRQALGEGWIAAPILPATGPGGFVIAHPKDGGFSAEDESLLVLLTQMLSACLANAALHTATQDSEARMSALLSASPAAIIALTPQAVPEQWNPAAMSLYGWGPSGTAALPDEVAACVVDLIGQVQAGALTSESECRLAQPDGERSLLLMVAPITSPSVGITGYLLISTDDTARRHLAEQFQQAQRLDVVGRLAGGVAHDFNNLLTVILGYADGLLRRFEPDDPNHRRVAAIHRAGTHAAALTKELLTISRHQVVRPVVLHPAEFVNEIAGMLERIVGAGVTVQVPAVGDHLAVRIDRMQLEQVLLNLAANARDAMPDGGSLVIDVTGAGDGVAITVTDTGTGMDAETLEHCLEPFFTTKQAGRGTGLGLAAVHGIVAQSGGQLRIDSRLGKGTTITVALPAVTAALDVPDDTKLPTPRDRVESGAATVLIVDDDYEIRSMVRGLLRERGYTTMVAHCADAALKLLDGYDGPLDLVLTDVAMAGMSGIDLARELRDRHPATSASFVPVPVLFMSGFAEEEGIGQYGEFAEADFVAKPFTPDGLVRQVEDAIRKANWAAEQPEISTY